MLARLPGLEELDIVATENILAAGFHERIHDLLPGIEEERREERRTVAGTCYATSHRHRRACPLVYLPRS